MAPGLQSPASSSNSVRVRPNEHFEELQRARLIAALIEAVEADDHAQPTVAQIIARARVARKTFYDLFCDREDCFLAAFDQVFSRAGAVAAQAYAGERSWRAGVRAALSSLLALIDQQPGLARLCIVHSLGAGERVRLRRVERMAELAEIVDRGRAARTAAGELPQATSEMIVGGVNAVIHSRLVRHDEGELHDLLGPLMSMIVLPYLGPTAARKEAGAPAVATPAPLAPGRRRDEDPLARLQMRLTYRTVRVLVVLSGRPGVSNREIAEAAGIFDQGQISKLLTRLARLGLVENRGEGQRNGGCNAWWLTAEGARLEQATHPRLI